MPSLGLSPALLGKVSEEFATSLWKSVVTNVCTAIHPWKLVTALGEVCRERLFPTF